MLRRIGIVAWWLGAITAAMGVIGLFVTIFTEKNEMLVGLATIVVAVVITTGALWVLSYILTGSFWRPPQVEED